MVKEESIKDDSNAWDEMAIKQMTPNYLAFYIQDEMTKITYFSDFP